MYLILIILFVTFIYTTVRRKKLEAQVELFNKLLYIEKSPENYIAEIDKLLLKLQSEKERNINLIQKTTGLFYLGKFDEAILILEKDVTRIPSNWQVVYYHNLLLSLYFKGSIEKANNIFLEVKITLEAYYKKDYNRVTIDLIQAVSDFNNKKLNDCYDFFVLLSEIAKNDYRIAMAYYFIGKINELNNKLTDAEENIEKARTYGYGSFIEHL